MTWNDLTIRQFTELAEVLKTEDPGQLETQVKLLCALTGESFDFYAEMPLPQLKEELKALDGLGERKEADIKGKYTINGRQYVLTLDFHNMKAGQYIDYVNTVREQPENRAFIMAILLVPRGKSYGEGYQVSELAETLYNHMKWCDVEAICFFFRLYFSSYTRVRLSYLRRKLKKEMKKERCPEKIQALQKSIQVLRQEISGIRL